MNKLYFLVILALLLQACGPTPTAATKGVPSTEAPAAVTDTPGTGVLIHASVPAGGIRQRARAHDNENSKTFRSKKVSTGDEFVSNHFERPFTSNDMVYVPDVDIFDFSISSDDTFFYILISFVGLDADTQSLTGSYGVEIDRDRDGRAEILVATKPPYDTEFTPDNVFVYIDLNGDIGGNVINRHDDLEGDGFEAAIFDLSQGVFPQDDPDLAWVRRTTDGDYPAVEIAYKKWIFKDGKERFLWSVLASSSKIDPTKLYFQDSLTAEQAGAANTDDPNYPVKELAEFDNSCRVPFGFEAQGFEPLGCLVNSPETDIPDEPDAESTCRQFGALCTRIKDRFILLVEQK